MKRLSSSTLLRASAIVSLLYALGHHSGNPWTPGEGAAADGVVSQMRAVSFQVEGFARSYWDFYYGFGVIITAFLVVQAAALWSLARVAQRDPVLAVPLSGALLVGALVNAGLSYRYFFALPALLSVLIAVLIGASIGLGLARKRGAAADITGGAPVRTSSTG